MIHATSVNSDLYKVDGVYLDGQKISTELSISEFKFNLDRDAEVEIRYISLV